MMRFSRLYHVSLVSFSMKKLGLRLNKMINPKDNKKWFPHEIDNDLMPSVKSLSKTQKEPGKRAMKRIAVLNKLFMKHITDIMSTGTSAMNILGKGIEISKVQVTSDLQKVNVFWICKGISSDKDTEALLQGVAGPLRHELSTLRLMGEVPYIEFVKDLQEAHVVELDRRLAVADYGEGYTPTEMGELLKSEFILNSKLSPEMQAKIKQLEEVIPPIEEPIPEMTHNIYGLDHDKIMNRLLAARKKSRDAWSKVNGDTVISYRVDDTKQSPVDLGSQKKELADFLLQRKILQNKLQKELRRPNEDWQLELNGEEEEEETIYEDSFIDDYDEDNDYVYKHDFRNDANSKTK